MNLIPCELDCTPTSFRDTKILTHEIELPPAGNKIGFNLLDDEYFTIPYVTYTRPNLSAVHQISTQAKKNCGSLIQMEKILSQIKACFMNSIAIKIHIEIQNQDQSM